MSKKLSIILIFVIVFTISNIMVAFYLLRSPEDAEIFCGKVSLEEWKLLGKECEDLSDFCEEAEKIEELVCMGKNILDDCRNAKIEFELSKKNDPIKYFTVDKYDDNHCLYTLTYADEEYFKDKDKIFANTEISCTLEKPSKEYNSKEVFDYPGQTVYSYFFATSFMGGLHVPECEGSYYEPFNKGIKCLTDEHCLEGKECKKTNSIDAIGNCIEIEEEKITTITWNTYKNEEYNFKLKYPKEVCFRNGECQKWAVEEEKITDHQLPKFVVYDKKNKDSKNQILFYPKGFPTGWPYGSKHYHQKEDKINDALASFDIWLTEDQTRWRWDIRFLEFPPSWSEYNFLLARAENDLKRKCGDLLDPGKETTNEWYECVEKEGITFYGEVNKNDVLIIEKIISTIEFTEEIKKKTESEYQVRWTDYTKIDNLKEINSLFDKHVSELSRSVCDDGYPSPFDMGRDEERKEVHTCREYIIAQEEGFSHFAWNSGGEKSCFWYPCGYLYFFEKVQPATESYIEKFDLKEDWRELPLYDIFDVGQMGMPSKESVDQAEITEFEDYRIKGSYDKTESVLKNIEREVSEEASFVWKFDITLLGWGDYNNNGKEDMLLWYSEWDSTFDLPRMGRRYNPMGYVVVSQTEEDEEMFLLNKFTDLEEKDIGEKIGVEELTIDEEIEREVVSETAAGWKTYKNEKYNYEIKYPENYRIANFVIEEERIRHKEGYGEEILIEDFEDFVVITDMSIE